MGENAERPPAGRFVELARNIGLTGVTLLACFLVIEVGYRILDPFPHYGAAVIEQTEFERLMQYDATLGWKGKPSVSTELINWNARIQVTHNTGGFRDVEHPDSATGRPAIVFLGDSFTWGYEVQFDEMFVNRIRTRLPGFEIYNLAHNGYGTDQALLTLKRWHHSREIRWVVLMFSRNDLRDNDSTFRYDRPKPRFAVDGDSILLVGVPVPRAESWDAPAPTLELRESRLRRLLFRSHFLHDVHRRIRSLSADQDVSPTPIELIPDMSVTLALLRALRDETEARGASLLVFLIPDKAEIEGAPVTPYQQEVAPICEELAIECVNLASRLERKLLRTYFRLGIHWNSRGHRVAADAIHERLTQPRLDARPALQ